MRLFSFFFFSNRFEIVFELEKKIHIQNATSLNFFKSLLFIVRLIQRIYITKSNDPLHVRNIISFTYNKRIKGILR